LIVAINSYVQNSAIYSKRAKKIDDNYSRLNHVSEQSEHSSKQAILAIGNSYVATSVIPHGVNNPFIKFTVAGMPMANIIRVVESLSDHSRIRNVLVGLGYNYATPTSSDANMYKAYLEKNELLKKWWSIPMVRGRQVASSIVTEDIKQWLARQRSGKRSEGGAENMATELTAQTMERSIEQRLREYAPFTRKMSDTFLVNLLAMKRICAKKGMSLFLYTAPVMARLRRQLDPAFIDSFHTTIEGADIPYIDLNLETKLDDATHFKDATHLNRTGGLLVTRRLAGCSAKSGNHS